MLWMQPLRLYFQFSGRAGRAEYWQFMAFFAAAYIVGGILDIQREGIESSAAPTLALLVLLGLAIPGYAVTFRRLHDRGNTGWLVGLQWVLNGVYFVVDHFRDATRGSIIDAPFALINGVDLILTVILGIYLLVQVCRPGDVDDNQYGPPPVVPIAPTTSSVPIGAPSLAATARPDDRLERLERLAELRRRGVLTEAEFEQQKAALD